PEVCQVQSHCARPGSRLLWHEFSATTGSPMLFKETTLNGAFVVEIEPQRDERGFFARTFCEREFAEHGLPTRFPQCNLSRNARVGTLRVMHFQAAPLWEAKLVR